MTKNKKSFIGRRSLSAGNTALVAGITITLLATHVCFAQTGGAGKPHGSDYVKNLTQTAAHDSRWQDQENQLAVSGSSVHVAWHASTTSTNNITTNRIYYARSLDQGVTFQPWVLLDEFTESGYNFGRQWLAVDGQDVHLVTVSQAYLDGGGGRHGQVLRHHRSTDGGATFQPAQVLGTTGPDEGFGVALLAASGGNVSLAIDFGKVSHPTSIKFLQSTNGGVSFSGDVIHTTWFPIWLSQLTQRGRQVVLAWEDHYSAGFWHDGVAHVACSTNAGASFAVTGLQDAPAPFVGANHSDLPRTAFAETNVLAVFITENTNATPNRGELRLRRSTDSGVTFGPPVNLAPTLVDPAVEVPADDQCDLALAGQNVCVAFATTGARLYLARSTNGGATFLPTQLLADVSFHQGAPMQLLQPRLAQDPLNPSQLHLFWSGCWYARSTDGGATWTPAVNLMLKYSGWLLLPTPQVAADSSGALHWNVTGWWHASDYDDSDILYRRFSHVALPAGMLNLAAQFVQDHDNFSFLRYDNLQIAAVPSLQFSNEFSVETWVKVSAKSLADSSVTVLSQKASDANEYDPYALVMRGDYPGSNRWFTAEIGMTGGVASRVLSAPAVLIRPDVWYHLALTFDVASGQPNLNFYVNGVLQDFAQGAFPLATSTGLTHLATSDNADDFLEGALDDLRFWNRALTAQEIRDRFTGPLVGDEPGLAAYYTFDDTWADSTGQGLPAVPMYRESFGAGADVEPWLQIEALTGDQVRLSWLSFGATYALKSSATVANPEWQSVPGTPVKVDGRWTRTVSAGEGTRFFRLERN